MIFYDKYIIQNRVFLYAFHQRESENAKLALKNQHLRVSVLNSQLTWVKLSLEVKGFHRITHIMLKLVLEPTWMPKLISYKLIFITNAFHIGYKQKLLKNLKIISCCLKYLYSREKNRFLFSIRYGFDPVCLFESL